VDRLYDYQPFQSEELRAAGTWDSKLKRAEMVYFDVPLGAARQEPSVGFTKTLEDTNLYLSHALAGGTEFLIESIEVALLDASREAYFAMAAAGRLEVQILDRIFNGTAPLGRYMRPWVITTRTAEGLEQIENAPWVHGPWELKDRAPLYLMANQMFSARIVFERDRVPDVKGRLGVVLNGLRYRRSS
jgi:hypothetical protein